MLPEATARSLHALAYACALRSLRARGVRPGKAEGWAADIAQETFCVLLNRYHSRPEGELYPLAARIAWYQAVDAAKQGRLVIPFSALTGAEGDTPFECGIPTRDGCRSRPELDVRICDRLRALFASLPARESTWFWRRYRDQRRPAELAADDGLDPSGVSRATTRILREIRAICQTVDPADRVFYVAWLLDGDEECPPASPDAESCNAESPWTH